MADTDEAIHRSWLQKITDALSQKPQNLAELQRVLHQAVERRILDKELLRMIEGAISVSELQVRDIMIPASHLVLLQVDMPFPELLETVIQSGHSRFPVIGTDRDDVLGIFLAKDLLPYLSEYLHGGPIAPIDIRHYLRAALHVPESKRLSALLKEFRRGRNHMALVIDEYGSVSGLVTLEDVLEEIVGDISDEYDKGPDSPFVRRKNNRTCVVEALMPIDAFNTHFHTDFSDTQYDTIGGWVLHHFGRVPVRGDRIKINGLAFKVISADSRRIRTLEISPDDTPPGQ